MGSSEGVDSAQCQDCGAIHSIGEIKANHGLCPTCGMREFLDIEPVRKERRSQERLARER